MHVWVSILHNPVWQRRKKIIAFSQHEHQLHCRFGNQGKLQGKINSQLCQFFRWTPFLGISKHLGPTCETSLKRNVFACFVFREIRSHRNWNLWKDLICLLKKCFLIRCKKWECERVELLNFAPKMSKFIGFEVKTFGKFYACTWDDDFFQ